MEENNLILLNKNTPTYFSYQNKNKEILDLIICSNNISKKLIDFTVLDYDRLGSDHAPIICTLNIKKEEQGILKIKKNNYNFGKADWKKFQQILNDAELPSSININNIDELNQFICNSI